MTESRASAALTALEAAADWQLRLAEDPASEAEFDAWLNADPTHRQAWDKIQWAWAGMPQLASPAPPASAPLPTTPTPRRRRRPRLSLALTACVIALAALLYPTLALRWQADHIGAARSVSRVTLDDGSIVTLAPGSAIAEDYSAERRQLTLLRGEAFFDVRPDARRPFLVGTRDVTVRVLGTGFDVAIRDDHLNVAVEHGQVQVADAGHGALRQEYLTAGEQLALDWASGDIRRSTLLPEHVAGWRDGLLYVDDRPVSEIVDDLGRYSERWILLRGDALGQRRISGVFDLRDPDRALQGLAQSLSAQVRSITPWVSTLQAD